MRLSTSMIYVSIKREMCAKHSRKNLRLLCSSLVVKKEINTTIL